MEKARLSQDEWRRVEEVYHEALEHRPESRAAFVIAACGAESSLRREVESLLAAAAPLPWSTSPQWTSRLNCSTTALLLPLAPS
jgi:hypothetical protein